MDQEPKTDDATAQRLATLGTTLAGRLEEAKQGRKDSGIEDVWRAAEEAYLGIDDVNRAQWSKQKWAKPTSMQGPVTSDTTGNKNAETRSTVFIPLTARYVDAGHAKVSELLLPMDDKPFSFDPTPVPELIAAREQLKQIMSGAAAPAAPAAPAAADPAAAMPGMMGGAAAAQLPAPVDSFQAAKQAIATATASAKAAEKRIYDWLVECRHTSEMRKVLFDGARIGVGVLKGPFADIRKSMAVQKDVATGNVVLIYEKKTCPVTRWIDPWNFWPDPACGEDISTGDYCFERDYMSSYAVEKLKDLGYISTQIDKVLREGPSKAYVEEDGSPNAAAMNDPKIKARRFEVYHYYGIISRDDALAGGTKGVDSSATNSKLYAVATIINDTVVRIVLNPLDSGHFPYRAFPWRRRAGHWAGIGIGEQANAAQTICNGATRAMLTNAGLSSGIQLIIDNTSLVPADNSWIITPNKVWLKKSDATIEDMTKAFSVVKFPDQQESLLRIIEYSFRIAEESTNIPLISQGQSGPSTPDTFGAAALQNNNANQLLRDIAATCDDTITEPTIIDFYEWLLLDPDVPNDEKGDFKINAHGSIALVERSIQDQTIQNLVEPALNPAFGLSPERVMEEYLKSKRIDPRSVKMTDEEKAEAAKRQPPPPPAVMAAQIRAQAQMGAAQLKNQTDQLRIKRDTDRDTVFVQAEQQRTQGEFMSRRDELMVRRELAIMQYADKHQQTLEQIKGKLADTVMRLRTQKELAIGSARIDLHKHHNPQVIAPAAEPPQRAPDGQAFTQ